MENNTSQNQGNSGNSNQQNQNKSKGGSDNNVLSVLQPHDMSRTVESAMHVVQGNHEKLPELMQDLGTIIVKATKRFSTTQLILTAGALTIGAVLLARYSAHDDEFEYAEAS